MKEYYLVIIYSKASNQIIKYEFFYEYKWKKVKFIITFDILYSIQDRLYINQAMQQSLQDYQDMFAGMTEDILKNIFIRFYTMQDYFEFTPSQIQDNQSQTMQQQPKSKPDEKKTVAASLFFNRVISQCICDLHIMNKLINGKAKIANALLDNGITIAKKKSSHWGQFINEQGFGKLKQAYTLLPAVKKNIIKYAVMSISNLLLKLSINMSKVSVIPLQKFLNFQCLNIPVLSIVFLQYLQFNLFKSKNITDPQQQVNFFKQLPKITFIKLNYYKNNTDLQQLENSQQQFITKQTKQTVKNLQYIEIHQKSHDPVLPIYQRKTTYQYIHSIDLEKLSKGTATSPFTFEILEIMRQVVFTMVKDFKPDLIVYMESYPNGQVVMDDETRGLMICEMAQETTCNKMYIFKEMGPDKFNLKQYAQLNPQGQQITLQNCKIFETQETKIAQKFSQKMLLKPEDKKSLEKIKKVFMNELCFVSLALIQKTSFEKAAQASHKHFFKREFLQGILDEQNNVISKNDKNHQGLVSDLKIKSEGVKMMLQVLKFKEDGATQKGYKIINLMNQQNCFTSFFNLQSQSIQPLVAESQNAVNKYFYGEQDNFIVKYYDNEKKLITIIIKYVKQRNIMEIIVLSKYFQMKTMKLQAKIQVKAEDNYIQGATYICSNDFLYRGFGKFRLNRAQNNPKLNPEQAQYNKAIHRLQINPFIGQDWELVDCIGTIVKSDGKQQPKAQLEKKVHGYGIFDADNKAILMMGGYIDSSNQEKISKKIYLIKNADIVNGKQPGKKICMLGKTNKIIYNNIDNIKNMFLNPFVYGIPFFFNTQGAQKGGAFVLNSNGYYLNLNHTNKIFTTLIKLSQVISYNGINVQNKLKISQDLQQASTAIFLAEVLIKCIVIFPSQINIKGNQCCIQTLEEGHIFIEANLSDRTLHVKAPEIFQDDKVRKLEFI